MHKKTFTLLFFAVFFSSLALVSFAAPPKKAASLPSSQKAQERSFRDVMVILQQQMQLAMLGILNEHYGQIQQAGLTIAHHPSPSLKERKRLARTIAPVRKRFRVVGRMVHQGAKDMARAAQKKQMPAVLKAYDTILRGCVGCHQLTRATFLSTK